MLPPISGTTQQFLAGLDRIQLEMNAVQGELSSGIRVGRPSDDPAAVASILGVQTELAVATQSQTNLDQVKTELQTSDSALQSAVQAIDQALAIAAQGATSTSSTARTTLIDQVQAIQEQLVSITQTKVSGRYIFSGDLDQQPLYALDSTQPNGISHLAVTTSTRVITDGAGRSIWVPKTAQEIFDARNPDSTPASGNVFDAVNQLLSALKSGDTTGAATAADALNAANDHLNQELGLYGIAENSIAEASAAVATDMTSTKQNLSTLRDADIAGDAIRLSQLNLQQQAALSARSSMSKLNLFDFLT